MVGILESVQGIRETRSQSSGYFSPINTADDTTDEIFLIY